MTSDRIRVLHVLPWLQSGGVERRRLLLAERMDTRRYEQRVVCSTVSAPYRDRFEAAGVPVMTARGMADWALSDVAALRGVCREIARFRPHIIHGAVFEGASMAARAGRLCRVPVILTEETSHPTSRSLRGHVLYRAITALAHHTVAVSPWVGSYLTDQLRVPRRRVSVITNGVEERSPPTPDQRAAARVGLGVPADAFVVGTVCRLDDHHKRVTDLIDAFAIVASRVDHAVLLVVGAGPDDALMRARAVTRGVANRVVWTGRLADPGPAYDAMDVFALLSRHEAFGLVLVEAMFAALPVVASAVGGIPGIVDDGVTGHLVPPFAPRAAAASLLELASDPHRARLMGRAGAARARGSFGATRYVNDVAALYERLVSAASLPGS